jgi:outer membrane protein OmpA-like peptidoglycan-associated protein
MIYNSAAKNTPFIRNEKMSVSRSTGASNWMGVLLLLLAIDGIANDLNCGGQNGVLRTLSAQSLGFTGFNIGGGFKYSTDYDYVKGPGGGTSVLESGSGTPVSRETPRLLSGNVFGAFGLLSIMDISMDLPVYYDITGWGERSDGVGDLEVALKVAFPGQLSSSVLTQAYYLNVIFPTGDKSTGYFPRHSYYVRNDPRNTGIDAYSIDAVFFNPMLVWTLDFSRLKHSIPLLFHANVGGVVAKAKSGSAVVAALALEIKPARFITLFTELTGESRVKYYTESFSIESFDNDPFRLTPGMRLNFPGGVYLIGSGDIGFSDGQPSVLANWDNHGYQYATRAIPKWAAQAVLGWSGNIIKPDRDKDGIPDRNDRCPAQAEDRDGFEDTDGCPDFDNDKDGLPDVYDSCPNSAAINKGCPVVDRDKDGIDDDRDRCPAEPEDVDGYEDGDGCPDIDNDLDGVLDVNDTCPTLAEDPDGFHDEDGCPDADNDGDGIFDVADKCPDIAGDFANSGCPAPKKAVEIPRGRLVLTGVQFMTGSAVLSPGSYVALDKVAASLKEWTEVRVEIQGHTDSRGDSFTNQQLSQARAEAVRVYLIQQGVAPDRLTAVGYGEEQPIETNNTAAGRQKNRRVEMRRID